MIVQLEVSQLMERYTDTYDKVRLLASSSKHCDDWLHAIPISFCGLRLDDEVVRIAVVLCLGINICEPHVCICRSIGDVRGSHALLCKHTSGCLTRHNHLNDIVLRSLTKAKIPPTREPAGLLTCSGLTASDLTV